MRVMKGTSMKILFTGATGVLGRAAIPLLVDNGHEVTAISRTEAGSEWLESVGARPMSLDLFDAKAVEGSMGGMDAVVHYATAIPRQDDFGTRDAWEMNDRLRSIATGILVDAAMTNGVARFIQESITYFYADGGHDWIDEESPVAPGWDVLDSAIDAENHVDRFRSAGGTGVTLRLSRLYGPGRASEEYIASVADRRIPIVGEGGNYVSSIHTEDAATALAAAISAPDGVYNVSDDRPVTSARYTESLAELLGAPRPRHVPAILARIAAGKAVALLTASHRVSSRLFQEVTGWAPAYPSVVEGWKSIVGGAE